MRFLVMGAGAMGSAIGGFLAAGGHDVTLVGRDPHMSAIRAKGLRITGIWGDHHVRALATETSIAGLDRGSFDCILITVKSYDTSDAVRAVKTLVVGDAVVCSYQNGLGNAEIIADAVGWERTIGARVIFGVRLEEAGLVAITVIAEPTALGIHDRRGPAGRARAIAAAMNSAGIPTTFTDDLAPLIWGKVAYNSALNPLSALLDVPYGALLESEETRQIMREVVHELYAVAQACGVRLAPETGEAYVGLLFEKLIPPTAAHYASMREDFLKHRRTEIEALNGAICRYGDEYGVACPTNALLARLVRGRGQLHRRGR
jgi:2-dehydropantoate 2-reductase